MLLYCHPCGKEVHHTWEDSLRKHTDNHDVQTAKKICAGAKLALAAGYEQSQERRKEKEMKAKEHSKQKRK